MLSMRIALRNVFRNKRRSIITLSIIITGSVAIILSGGWFSDIMDGLKENTIHGDLAHFQISKKGFFEKGITAPYDYMIDDYAALSAKIAALPHVKLVLPRVGFSGLLSTGDTTVACIGVGVDPEKENLMTSYQAPGRNKALAIVAGEDLSSAEPRGAIVGKGLADALAKNVGDSLMFLTTTKGGSINGIQIRIRGIFEGVSKEFDDRAIKLPIETASRVLHTSGQVQKVLVLLDDTALTPAAQRALEALTQDRARELEFKTWRELAYNYERVVVLLGKIFGLITVIITATVILGIANTMNMIVFERVREIGTIMAIGSTRMRVLWQFLLEGAVLGVLGSLLGIGLGIGLAKLISLSGGIPMPPPPGSTRGFVSHIRIVPAVLQRAFMTAILAAVISSLYPAVKSSRLKIAEALRHV